MSARLPSDSLLANEASRYPYCDRKRRALATATRPDAAALLSAFLNAAPDWARLLMAARDRLVAPLGLKTAGPARQAPTPPFVVGQQFGVFRLLQLAPHEVVLGEDDRHLDFRIVLRADVGWLDTYTLVRPHNPAGWLYLAGVLPAHHLIAATMSTRMARQLEQRGHEEGQP